MTDLNPERIAAIRAGAEKAGDERYVFGAPSSVVGWPFVGSDGRSIASFRHVPKEVPGADGFNARQQATGEHLANCDPATIIALCDKIKKLEAERESVTKFPIGTALAVEHDGFAGTVQGYYVTRQGKFGIVLQQHGTRVVHVYSTKWFATITEPPHG